MSQLVQYNTASGVIQGIIFNQATLPPDAQVAAWAASGMSCALLPDSPVVDASTGTFLNGVYMPYAIPTPIPNIVAQLVAALINNGTVTADAFHPTTVAQLNTALTTAKMPTVSLVAASATPAIGMAKAPAP